MIRVPLAPGYQSVAELYAAYRNGDISPVDVVDDVLARSNEVEHLNVFITVDHAGARAAAAEAAVRLSAGEVAPLLGVPVTVKDLIPTKNLRTTRGSLITKDHVPCTDAPCVERLRRAGAVIIGKTNTSEGGWTADAGNRILASSVNPWDDTRSAGGSSGGAAVATAAGLGPIALGTDGAGSVRIPAAFCGVVGYKPSFGLVPYWPNSSDNLSHLGVLARSVVDATIAVDVMAGPDPRDMFSAVGRPPWTGIWSEEDPTRRLRVGVSHTLGFAEAEDYVNDSCSAVADDLARLGHDVVELDMQLGDPYDILDTIWAGHEAASHFDRLDDVAHLLDPGYEQLIRRGRRLSAGDLAHAHDRRHHFAAAMRQAMADVDVLVTPTVPIDAFVLGQSGTDHVRGQPTPGLSWTPFTYPFNLTGQPAISVPTGLSPSGLPMGAQFVGHWRDDNTALTLAHAYETYREWKPNYSSLITWAR